MAGKKPKIERGSFRRTLAVSLAGARAGGAFAIDGAWAKLRPGKDGSGPLESEFARREARRFVAELGRLKGTYVKIGQMLALLGEHFLPPVLTEALHELESGTEPLLWEDIESHVREALGERYAELIIDQHAIAAASLSQVHRATIAASGEQICLKIQYPGLAELIDTDFDTVVRMLLIARWIKSGRELDAWLEFLREQLHREMDYQLEGQMTDQVAQLVQSCAGDNSELGFSYYVPHRHQRYCTDTILALEYIDGFAVTRAEVVAMSQSRRNALGRAMLELFFYELYQWGVLQTDPNFGNYLIRSQGEQDELVLLDFGSMLPCDEHFLVHLGNAIAASQAEDREQVLEGLIGLGCLKENASTEAKETLTELCLQLGEPLRESEHQPAEYLNERGEYCWSRSQLTRRVGKMAADSAFTRHFTTPSRQFAMIARKLTGVFTFIVVIDAQFNAADIVRRHTERWLERS